MTDADPSRAARSHSYANDVIGGVNAQQLVLRRDSSDSLLKVGWAVEMPLGRFEHIAIIAEHANCEPLHADHPLFSLYQSACRQARESNRVLLRQQHQQMLEAGWKYLDNAYLPQLSSDKGNIGDDIGSLREHAMNMLFQLTANHPFVWCVEQDSHIVHVQSKKMPSKLQELEAQVWTHHQFSLLQQMPGCVLEGRLVVKESGLWFEQEHNTGTANS